VSNNAVDQARATRPFLLPALLVLGAGWLAASPSYASVSGAWADEAARDQTFSRVLIVGISPDLNVRCPFERTLASRIKSEHTVAIVSCDVMPLRAELTRESVEAAVAEQNADAVLTTSLISKEWEAKEGATRDSRGAAYYKANDSFYGVYGTVVSADFRASGPITSLQGEAHIVSKLYETRGATVVYTIETKVRNIESRDEGLAAITAPIGKKLRKEGVIR
jgi:hypothetical protein